MTTGYNPFLRRGGAQIENGKTSMDNLLDTLARERELKMALRAVREDESDGPAPAPQDNMGQAGKFMKDIGVDVGQMQARQDAEREKLEARAERAERARLTAETADRSDGLNSLSTDLARMGINALVTPKPDPVMDAVREVYAKKMVADLTGERPTPIQEVTNMMDGWGAMIAMMQRLAPPAPAAVTVGMSPEKAFELEMKKLDNHMELEKHKADRDAQIAEKKASAWKEVADVLRQAAESIGNSLGSAVVSQMGSNNGAQPATTRPRPSARQQTVEATAEAANCPDCHENAVMLTQTMIDHVAAGGEVQATCTNCASTHTVGSSRRAQPESPRSQAPADPISIPSQRQPRQRIYVGAH